MNNGPLPPNPLAADWLQARARTTPQALALLIGEDRWHYGELDQLVDRYAGWLGTLNLEGRPLGVLLPNGLPYVAFVHACARAGIVIIPLNLRLTGTELTYQLTVTDCRMVIAQEDDREKFSEEVHVLNPPDEEALETASRIRPAYRTADAVQAIVFTSGTTGRPKAVPITFKQHFYSAIASAFHLGVDANDIWLSCLPLYHMGGLAIFFRSCLYGTAVDLHARFDVEAIGASLKTIPITLISLVPTMLVRLMAAGVGWPSALRMVLLGGAATPPDLVAKAAAQGVPTAVSYGMTEAASQIATLLPPRAVQKPGCVGRPLLFGQVKIVEESGAEAAVNQYGDIWVSGPNIARGYLAQPAENARRFVDGWFNTGDIGYLDDDGDLWLVQRRSDLIISGGENVYPAEVERALSQHPAVAEVVVVGLEDPEWGQQVAAMVVVVPGTTVSKTALLDYGRAHLAGYKLPRQVAFVDALPRTASGKVARRQVIVQLQGL